MKKHPSRTVMNFRHLLGCDTIENQNAQKSPKPKTPPSPPPMKEHITNVPVRMIKELNRALKGHAKSYGIELQDN